MLISLEQRALIFGRVGRTKGLASNAAMASTVTPLRQKDQQFEPAEVVELKRAGRYAAARERLITADDTFPSLGRLTTRRFGVF